MGINSLQNNEVRAVSKYIRMSPEEEAKKVTLKNYQALVPEEKHVYANRRLSVSAYTERWFAQKIKKLIKTKSLEQIKLEDFL